MHEQAICWINGKILRAEDAALSIFDHGLLYGDGVFEGIRFYHHQPFRLHAHLERLFLSARAINLTIPYLMNELSEAVEETLSAYSEADGYLRLVVTRGTGPLGLDPSKCGKPNVFIIADDLDMVSRKVRQRGARVIIASTRRLPADGLDARIKSLNYMNHILARIEANCAAADEAILLNTQGRVAEGTADNLFLVIKGKLFTPPATEGALEGVTRNLVMQLAQDAGISVRETPLTPYDLYTADECFLSGTGAELIPVEEVDGRRLLYCPGPAFVELEKRFRAEIERQVFYPNE